MYVSDYLAQIMPDTTKKLLNSNTVESALRFSYSAAVLIRAVEKLNTKMAAERKNFGEGHKKLSLQYREFEQIFT